VTLAERFRAWLHPGPPAARPAPARVTTAAERAPLYAAYAAARAYAAMTSNPYYDDATVRIAVTAYEKELSGGNCVSPIPSRPGSTPDPGFTALNLLGPIWTRPTGMSHTAYRDYLAPTGGPDVTLPREVANRIETLLIDLEESSRDTGTVVNALRRILSDAIERTDGDSGR
jgi:hypothetical protein